jgi:uncharacterized protein
MAADPRLERLVLASPILGTIVRRWAEIALPDCWLVAGAVVQTVWNDMFVLPPDHGLADVDLVYFDGSDLSEHAEAAHEARIRRLFADIGVRIDVKNEARVHIWYAAKFGNDLAPYTSTAHAISTFPTTATAIGVQPTPNGLRISAPFGLSDLFDAVVRPNKVQASRAVYEAKVARWRAQWPRLKIKNWTDPE